MYLSRVPLDMNNRSTMRAMTSSSLFHGALEECFPGERKRKLWRIDCVNGTTYFMLLSEDKPDLTSFCRQFSFKETDWETKDYSVLLSRLENGSVWHFRLTANPTKSDSKKGGSGRGKVLAHITTEYQKKWLLERAEKHGFALSDDEFDVVEVKWKHFRKKEGRTVTILSVSYEGILKITDVSLFEEMLTHGIGRGKAYGMGLMTIIK